MGICRGVIQRGVAATKAPLPPVLSPLGEDRVTI